MSRRKRKKEEERRRKADAPGRARPFLLAAAVVLVYLNSLPGILFWDSEVLILDNVFLRSFRYIPEILTTSVMAGGGEITNYWRPVPVLFFLLQYQLWGPTPLGYHAFNILVHAANALLVFLLAGALFRDKKAAFWTALLFALHPVQNETVNYVDHLEGMLTLSFGLGTLLLYVRGRRWTSLLPWGLCLLCKEEGVVFFPILAFFELVRPLEEDGPPPLLERAKTAAARLWAHGALLGAYAALHLTVFNFLKLPVAEFGAQPGAYAGLGLRLLTFAKALAVYARLLVLPTGLHFDRDMAPAASAADPAAWLAVLAAAAAVWVLWRLTRGERGARFGLLWASAAMLPTCGLVPFNNILAEHFLYIPAAGLFIALTPPARRALSRLPVQAAGLALALVFGFYAVQDMRRNRDWQDPVRLYETTLAGNPLSYRAANNLGAERFRKGDLRGAREAFEQSLRANRQYAPALNNIGAVIEAEGRIPESLEWYLRSSRADPSYALARKNAAGILLKLGKWTAAEEKARAALKSYPQYGDAWELLGASLYQQKRLAESREAFEKAVAVQPAPQTYRNLALVYKALGERELEAAARAKAAQLGR